MVRMVIFDMAGTTIDEQNLVYKTLHRSIEEAGFSISLEEVLTHCAGKEKRQAIIDALKAKGVSQELEQTAEKIFLQFKEALKAAYQSEPINLQPGASQLFEQLQKRSVKVVLNTGYDRPTTEQILQRIGYQQHPAIDLVVSATDVENSRPHPDMIQFAIRQLGLKDASEVVKVGDSIIDIQEGQEAGCRFSIGVTTGAHTYEQLQSAHPDVIIENLDELIPFLDEANALASLQPK